MARARQRRQPSHLSRASFARARCVFVFSVNAMQNTMHVARVRNKINKSLGRRGGLPSAIICWVHARRRGERDRTLQCIEIESLQVQEARQFRNL